MEKLNRNIALTAAVLAAVTIAIGAFGAHGLKEIVSGESLATFETRSALPDVSCVSVINNWLYGAFVSGNKKMGISFF